MGRGKFEVEKIDRTLELKKQGFSHKEIAEQLGLSVRTINCYSLARRNGFLTYKDYQAHLAQKKGFATLNDYQQKIKGNHSVGQVAFEKSFERSGNTNPRIRLPENAEKEELIEKLYQLVDSLPERLRTIIYERYFSNTPYTDIGKIFSITGERIGQLERVALERLRIGLERARFDEYDF